LTQTRPHLPSIDMVKGWAILGVTLIHSQALGDSPWMTLLFFHAVPVLIVIFGLNSEQWFRARSERGRVAAWYRRAIGRIAVPTWATLSIWWVLLLTLHPPFIEPSFRLALLHALGVPRHVGTGWFIAVLVQFVVLFPAFRWCVGRFGLARVAAVSFAVTIALLFWEHTLRIFLGRAGWTYLAPRFAAHLAFGVALADRIGRLDVRSGLVAVAFFLPLAIAAETCDQPWARIASRSSELPLTVVLLTAAAALARAPGARVLTWLGRHSLGLYLGQLLTHNFFLFTLGGYCTPYACRGGLYEQIDPWVYTGILILGSALWMAIGNGASLLVAGVRARVRGGALPR
jgi:peptidoglycan/LPS O-acetylase OafA/YrhL